MNRTLFSRVFGLYIVFVSVGLALLGGVASLVLTSHGVSHALDRVDIATKVAANTLLPVIGSSPRPIGRVVSELAAATDEDLSLHIVDASGRVEPADVLATDTLAQLRTEGIPLTGTTRGTVRVTGEGRMAYAIRELASNNGTAAGELHVLGIVAVRSVVSGTNSILVVFIGVAGALTIGLALFLRAILRWIRAPLASIQSAAERYARGELNVELAPDGPDELSDLAVHLNEMAAELRKRLGAISEQRNQLGAILSSMVEGVVVLNDARSIVSMNAAAGQLLNVSPDAADGRTLIDYLRNAQLDELAELAHERNETIERTVTLYRERPLHLQVHATPLRNETDAESSGTLLVMNDITRLKHLEDLRKDFVANVSHELKTPITSIKGFVETLLDGAVNDREHSRRFLSIILNHTDRLHAIIEDLLSLSRLEQQDQRITFYEFPIRTLLESALEICSPKAEAKMIHISSELEGEDLAWGNPNLLEQAMVNLIDNAVKYSPEGSGVEIHVTCGHEMLAIRVIDHGQGIRNRDLPRIFERFYRTDKARSRELGGTGLGLAIVKHIARAHLGEVSVQSILGEGSTFTIEIPQWRSETELDESRRADLSWDALA